MTGRIIDSSFAHQDPPTVRAAGFDAMARYLSVDNAATHAKIVTLAEARAIWAAGLGLVLAYEQGATSASWNGDVARAQADALGWPDDRPIYWTEDRYVPAALYPTVASRLDVARDASGRPAGIYGGAQLVQTMLDGGHATFGWIASALNWSSARSVDDAIAAAPGAHLVQLVGSSILGADENLILKPDYGQWPATTTGADDMDANEHKALFEIHDAIYDPGAGVRTFLTNMSAALDRLQKATPAQIADALELAGVANAVADELAHRLTR